MASFEERLTGGHPNSLGNTLEVVDEVLANTSKFDELFHCYFSTDEIVRLRTSNAIRRVCVANKPVVVPYLDRMLNEISTIEQASTQWTLSKLFQLMEVDMTPDQRQKAQAIMQDFLVNKTDWIVLNNTMETLTDWAKKDEELKDWLLPQLKRHAKDTRKSVMGRANKFLKALNG